LVHAIRHEPTLIGRQPRCHRPLIVLGEAADDLVKRGVRRIIPRAAGPVRRLLLGRRDSVAPRKSAFIDVRSPLQPDLDLRPERPEPETKIPARVVALHDGNEGVGE
jgi:hypothetical protein